MGGGWKANDVRRTNLRLGKTDGCMSLRVRLTGGRSARQMADEWWFEGGWRTVEDGLRFPMVGAWLGSGCIVVELSLRLPRGGCPSALCASRDSQRIRREGRDAADGRRLTDAWEVVVWWLKDGCVCVEFVLDDTWTNWTRRTVASVVERRLRRGATDGWRMIVPPTWSQSGRTAVRCVLAVRFA